MVRLLECENGASFALPCTAGQTCQAKKSGAHDESHSADLM